jgi:anaerobic ribonucleoside-triphosphate reductase activating protein
MNKLKYTHYDIVFQEVPNEVSLVFNISGCPYKCKGCHSQYLWEYTGSYISDEIDCIYNKYKGMLTCVCFMGGDQNLPELTALLFKVKYIYKLKSCVYSGSNNIHVFDNVLQYLDYLKIGGFIEECGGLDKTTTNQKFYVVNNCKLEDTTYKFNKKLL